MAVLSIDPETLVGIGTLISTAAAAIVSIVVAVRQTTTNRVIRRVEHQTNSLSDAARQEAYARGIAEQQVKQAAAVIAKVMVVAPTEEENTLK